MNALRVSRRQLGGFVSGAGCYQQRFHQLLLCEDRGAGSGRKRDAPAPATTHGLLQRDQNKTRANIDSIINPKIRIDC